MGIKKFTIILFFIFLHGILNAQNYFQQEVNYKIDVKLNDVKHELSASETMEYTNNSPNTLTFIYFHLWPNAYSNSKTALAKQKAEDGGIQFAINGRNKSFYDQPENQGYIDSLDFKVNGKKVVLQYDSTYIDICKIMLNEPLKSGEKIKITTPFHVKIPYSSSRMGHVGQSYQITQWYPKPAVYDKYGWHPIPYLNQGEFYSEFGSFDVTITVPKNYIVGATGDLQNNDEMEWLNQEVEKTKAIKTFDKHDMSFPPSSTEIKTITFKQTNVHDFAWFADKRFHVLKSNVELPNTKHKVTTWAMFTNDDAQLWLKAPDYINDALFYYSKWNGDYPYNQCTAVLSALSAGAGMEYPNITVIGRSADSLSLDVVVAHEVGHNWFYGMWGFNERRYAWMDEGINSFNEARYMRTKYGKNDCFYPMLNLGKFAKFFELDKLRYKKYHELGYLIGARMNAVQQASLSAELYSNMNYGTIVYFKTSRIFDQLLGYLGEDVYDAVMKDFFEKWKYKHPYPEDLRKAFEDKTGKNLGWVFDDLLQTTKKIDYKVKRIDGNKILVKNNGMINSPFPLSGMKNDEALYTKWYDGFAGQKWLDLPSDVKVDKIQLDYDNQTLDFNRHNNFIRTSGLFKKTEPLRFKFFGVLENEQKNQINFLPAMGWNNYNQYMLGMLFYNSPFPQSKFEYQLMPMYAFGSKDLAGGANLAYHILPYNSGVQAINLSLSGFQYAYAETTGDNIQKLKAEVEIHFRKAVARSTVENYLFANAMIVTNAADVYNIKNPMIIYGQFGMPDNQPVPKPSYSQIYNLSFAHFNNRQQNPYGFNLSLQSGYGFTKATVDANYAITYNSKKDLQIRVFGGTFLDKASNLNPIYYFKLSGSTGSEDYTYGETFLERYGSNLYAGQYVQGSNWISRQFIPNDGAFTTYSPYGMTNQWLLSLNLTSSLPITNMIKVYGNIGAFGNSYQVSSQSKPDSYQWEAGVKLSFSKNLLVIYLPLVMSNDLNNYTKQNSIGYLDRVRFSLKINQNNPFKTIKYLF